MRILFVAMGDSVHTARWLSQLNEQKWDIHLFPVAAGPLHLDLGNVTVHSLIRQCSQDVMPSLRQSGLPFPLRRGRARAQRLLERLLPSLSLPQRLASLIAKLQPDVVHSLEMQHAGYLTMEARDSLNGALFPPWIYSSWGSDLFYYGRKPEHKPRIDAVLAACDYYVADCQRDVKLAGEFGFHGEVLGVIPTAGGYDIQGMRQQKLAGPASSRRIIALKGYHDDNWAGRALVALKALRRCVDMLAGYEIVIYLATENVLRAVDELSRTTPLRITVLPHSPLDDVLKLFGRARLAIGVNVTDGTPNTMLEAMAMGAFPIQSDTVSTGEWITSGENGFVVPPEDPEAIAAAIRKALADDDLVDRAAAMNEKLTLERIDRSVIQPQVIAMYEKVARVAGAGKV